MAAGRRTFFRDTHDFQNNEYFFCPSLFTWLFLSESHELSLEVTVLSASPLQPHQRYITPYSSRKAL